MTKKWTEFSFILKNSSTLGVGVFAAEDLPKGIHVLTTPFNPRKIKTKEIPPEYVKYCIYLNDEESLCPERFDRMEIGWYINHSDTPNIVIKPNKDAMTLREIKTGEEIFIDYNDLNEPQHLKEYYYRKS